MVCGSKTALILAVALSVNAAAATKAIKFGKLWDGHKVIQGAVVIVDDDRIRPLLPAETFRLVLR